MLSDLREIGWRCAGAEDAELAAAVRALQGRADVFSRIGPPPQGEAAADPTTLAFAICHVPDDAVRAALKDAFCGAVEAVAGRPLNADRGRHRRTA